MIDWIKKFWWVLVAGFVFVAWIVLTILGKKNAAEKLAAIMSATRAKATLEDLDRKNEQVNKDLLVLADKRAAAEATHKDHTARLGRKLKETTTMTDDEIDAELKRRGHK